MSELKACPFCGGKVEPEDMGEAIVICCTCDLTPCAARATTEAVAESWNTRALAPALDRVIAEVEANHYRQFVISENFFITRAQNGALAISGASMAIFLRALRDSAGETGGNDG